MNQTIVRALAMGALLVMISNPVSAQSSPRTTVFSGYTWELRRSNGLEGPGPNRFLDNWRTIWTDDGGDLHLKLWSRLGTWYSAEVILTESLGYGTYVFETIGRVDEMDPSVILGMFTYDHNPEFDYREIDIEYGLFGSVNGPNAQFVLQPFDRPGNRLQFDAEQQGDYLTHAFTWLPDRIDFASYHGHRASELATGELFAVANEVARWTYDGEVPPPGNEKIHINLWLYESRGPSRDHEVVFRSFTYIPPD